MKETPLVSVVIPTYNSSGTLIRSIESVFKQTYRNFEIIVIDDGSTDDTKTVLAPYSNDKRIMYLYQDNAGCGVARNNGVAIAQGEFIAFLDADDYWHEEKLRFQMEIFEKHADVIVCYTESYIKEPLSDLVWETKRNIHQLPRSGILTRFFAFHNVVTLSSAIVRKSSFEKVGGFTNHYDLMMVADLDLWLKLAPTGKFYAIPTPLMFYQIHRGITQAQIRENH
jgi:glycosyltransferase involved in cell wall biosynthesis